MEEVEPLETGVDTHTHGEKTRTLLKPRPFITVWVTAWGIQTVAIFRYIVDLNQAHLQVSLLGVVITPPL